MSVKYMLEVPTMAGKYDVSISKLKEEGKGGRLIAAELNLNVGYVSKRLKALGLNNGPKNQYKPDTSNLQIIFDIKNSRLDQAAENYFKFLCDAGGFSYADPPIYEPYDLLVDFGAGWSKIQVKSSSNRRFGLRRMRTVPSGTRAVLYSADEVDYFFFYRSDGRCWLVPFEKLRKKTVIYPDTIFPNHEVKLIDD